MQHRATPCQAELQPFEGEIKQFLRAVHVNWWACDKKMDVLVTSNGVS